ncbi:MAG: hypothetical protein ABL894_06950 [Hyphomicrobium sp.]
MDQAAFTPADPPPGPASRLEHEKPGLQHLSAFVPEARLPPHPKAKLIEGLRRRIGSIERHAPALETSSNRPVPWTAGAREIDTYLGPSGLDTSGVHEIKPNVAGAGATAASMGFALRLAAGRLQQMRSAHCAANQSRILWCVTRNCTRETGELYAPGLKALGLDPACFLIIETARTPEALWAMEEGLKSAGLALVVGQFTSMTGAIGLTPARRLSLAAEQASTPCLLLTPEHAPPAAATSTRWRIDPAPSTQHHFDPRAPGTPRLTATLERYQQHSASDPQSFIVPKSFVLEWPHARGDETHRIPLAAALAGRAAGPSYPKRRTG